MSGRKKRRPPRNRARHLRARRKPLPPRRLATIQVGAGHGRALEGAQPNRVDTGAAGRVGPTGRREGAVAGTARGVRQEGGLSCRSPRWLAAATLDEATTVERWTAGSPRQVSDAGRLPQR